MSINMSMKVIKMISLIETVNLNTDSNNSMNLKCM